MSAFNVKTRRQLLSSAARTADTSSGPFTDQFSLGLRLFLNVTAASGTGGLTPRIRAYDVLTGNSVEISTGGAAITATGLFCYDLYPGIQTGAVGNVKESVSRALPAKWDVRVAHGDASSYTYSLTCEVLQ